VSDHNEDAILASLLALLPPGEALTPDFESELAKVLRVTARSIDRLEQLAEFVVEDADPRVTTTFLEDWERLLGLPECGDLAESTAERRAAVVEKYTRAGDLTSASLIEAAATIGFEITIADGFANPDEHYFDVTVVGAALPITYFRASESRSGDSLGTFGDDRLTCLLDARKPAHVHYRLTLP